VALPKLHLLYKVKHLTSAFPALELVCSRIISWSPGIRRCGSFGGWKGTRKGQEAPDLLALGLLSLNSIYHWFSGEPWKLWNFVLYTA